MLGKMMDWDVKYQFFDVGKFGVFFLDEADLIITIQGHQDQAFHEHK
jgi:ATP-dependent RNA helicase DDX19/DBP5